MAVPSRLRLEMGEVAVSTLVDVADSMLAASPFAGFMRWKLGANRSSSQSLAQVQRQLHRSNDCMSCSQVGTAVWLDLKGGRRVAWVDPRVDGA